MALFPRSLGQISLGGSGFALLIMNRAHPFRYRNGWCRQSHRPTTSGGEARTPAWHRDEYEPSKVCGCLRAPLCIQIHAQPLLSESRIQSATHAITGGAGESDTPEAEIFQLAEQIQLLPVHLHRLGARCSEDFTQGLRVQAKLFSRCRAISLQQSNVARLLVLVQLVIAADDHCAIRAILPSSFST